MIKQKKKYLAFLTHFVRLDATLHIQQELIDKLSDNFEKIYIINYENLMFFNKEKNNDEKNKKINIPSNFTLFNPKNYKEFNDFLIDKDILVISNLGRDINQLKIQFFLRYKNIKLIQISNFFFLNEPYRLDLKRNIILSIKFFLGRIIFYKILILLSNLGLIPKIEIRFLSCKSVLENIEKSPIKNFLYRNKLFYAKKIILVNSRSHDILLKNKHTVSEDYIVHIDATMNHPDDTILSGILDDEVVNSHYLFLNKSLKKLSEEFKKEIIVCIHPSDDIANYKSYLNQFKVVKFKTREYIYKSFMVTVFDSSAITDAILLKKRVLGLVSEYRSPSSLTRASRCADTFGFATINMKEIPFLEKNKILKEAEKNIYKYDNFIKTYHSFHPNILGTDQIVETIKRKFFL